MPDDIFDDLEEEFGSKPPEAWLGDLIDKLSGLIGVIQAPPESSSPSRRAAWEGTMDRYADLLSNLSYSVREKVHPDGYQQVF